MQSNGLKGGAVGLHIMNGPAAPHIFEEEQGTKSWFLHSGRSLYRDLIKCNHLSVIHAFSTLALVSCDIVSDFRLHPLYQAQHASTSCTSEST